MNKIDRDPWRDAESLPLWFALLVLVVMLIFLFGCAAEQKIDPTTLPSDIQGKIIEYRDKLKYVHVTDWLATLFIVGGAASIFMVVRGMKTGFPLLIASGGGLIALRLDQSLAEQAWPYFVMGCLLLAGFVWYFYVSFIKDRAFSEIIKGGELFQGWVDEKAVTRKEQFRLAQDRFQSEPTKKLVKQAKKKLEVKK